ncbi:MAG: AprI/Inh family metalloprotease inhibitor [Hyphomicrobiales bacterium]|nr:AprI/Inh family metalloprotease inhibitor [Hyphomicrobiales bacterium]
MGLHVFYRLAAACFAGALGLSSIPASAFDLSSVDHAAGVWRLSEDNGDRVCSLQLSGEATAAGLLIGLPPACRHAMPALANVAAWKLVSQTQIDFLSKTGLDVMRFKAQKTGLVATGPGGETYVLMTKRDVAEGAAKPVAAARGQQGGPAVHAADLPGRYSILRDVSKDTGCMLTLEAAPRALAGRAHLAPACRDNGIVVFDPQSWSFVGGGLRLTARKGHSANFDMTPDGSWQKDPKEGGKALGFRKMQ